MSNTTSLKFGQLNFQIPELLQAGKWNWLFQVNEWAGTKKTNAV